MIDRWAASVATDAQAPLVHEAGEERRVVDDLVPSAELRVLVAERVEAVRAGGDDGLHPVPVQRLDVRGREHLEDVLVAHPSRGVAGARLLLAEDREADARPVEARDDRARDASIALVERGRAADPVEAFELIDPVRSRRRDVGGRRHRERQARASSPSGRSRAGPTGCRDAPSP